MREQAGAALGAILGQEPGAEGIAGSGDPQALQMAAEIIRAGLAGLAIWWADHPEVPREQIVTAAVNSIWIGFERVSDGEAWKPPSGAGGGDVEGSPMPSDRFFSRLSSSLPDSWLRRVGRLNVPVYRLTRGRVMGRVGRSRSCS